MSRHRRWARAVAAQLALLGVGAVPAFAVQGPAPGAVSAQTLKLPDGPGSIRGLADDPSVDVFSGQVSYQVPLDLPASRRGFKPAIALAYRGDLGNGPLGVGWHVEVAAIRRSTRLGVPSFTAADELVLSGVGGSGRLIQAPDGSYRVEGRGNEVKIVAEGAGFRVFDATGVQYKLGVASSARHADGVRVIGWLVEEVTDPAGQTVRYGYSHDRGQIYLASVTYGPDDAFRVVFEHGDRPDVVTSYREGIAVTSGKRVTGIRVEAFGELARYYELAYDDGFPLSRLAEVRLHGRGGEGSLPPLTFDYAEADPAAMQELTGMGSWRLNERGVSAVDVDGDGIADLLQLRTGDHAYRRNLGGSFGDVIELSGADAASLDSARLVDVEGRARANLVTVIGDEWRPYRLSGPGWTALGAWTGTDGLPVMGSDVELADVNGDGRIDAIEWNGSGLFVRFGNATGLAAPVSRPPIGGELLPGPQVLWADYNGDGLADALHVTAGWLGVYLGHGDGTFEPRELVTWPWPEGSVSLDQLRTGDLNRDGVLDLLVVDSARVHWYRGRPGAHFADEAVVLDAPGEADGEAVVAIADINGNGSDDLLWSSDAGMWLLDMSGATTAGMLTAIDNGMGKRVDIAYEASAWLALEAAEAGAPWARQLPVSVPVAVRTAMRVGARDPVRVVDYAVRDGFWDAAEFQFGGFLVGRTTQRGAEPGDDLTTETRFHSGTGVNRVLRGKPVEVTVTDGDGALLTVTRNRWRAWIIPSLGTAPMLRKAALTETWTEHHEGAAGDPPVTRITYELDDQARIVVERNLGREDLAGDERVFERGFAADDDARWIRDQVCTERLLDGDSAVVMQTRIYFGDDTSEAPLCAIGLGWPRRVEGWLAEESRWVTLESKRYDAYGNPIEITQQGVTRELVYDDHDLHPVREVVRPAPGVELAYEATWDYVLGVPTSVTDPSGAVAHVGYDSLARPALRAVGDQPPHTYYAYDWERDYPRTSSFVFDGPAAELPAALPAWTADGQWRETVTVMDGAAAERVAATRLAASRWIVHDWREVDARGNTVFRALPFYADGVELPAELPAGAAGVAIDFDALGRPTRQDMPNGGVKTTRYGAFAIEVDRPTLATVRTELDGLGRVVASERTVDGTVERTETRYDAAGRITAFDIAGGAAVSTFSYDSLGRLVAADDPDIGPRAMRYDDAGRMIEHANGRGQTVTYAYDGAGRPLTTHVDGALQFAYHYDAPRPGSTATYTGGRFAWVEEPEGVTEVSYDAHGREVEVRRVIRGSEATITRALSPSGLRLGVAYDDGFAYAIGYDPAGRAVRVGKLWQAEELDAAGRPLREAFGNGVVQVTGRDALGQPAHVAVTDASDVVVYDVTVARNALGSITGVVDGDGLGVDHTASFGYDGGGRLTSATLGSGPDAYAFGYQYDALQNMIARTASGPAELGALTGTYVYGGSGAGPRQLTSVVGAAGTTQLWYDGAGRQVIAGKRRFVYDAQDQLVRVMDRTAAGWETTRHSYGYDHQRVVTQAPDGSIERWFSPELVERDGERDHYIAIDDRIVARVSTSGDGGGGGGIPDRRVLGAVTTWTGLGLGAGFLALLLVTLATTERRRWAAATTALALAFGPVAGCAGSGGVHSAQRAAGGDALYFHYGFGAGPTALSGADGDVVEERRYEPFGHPVGAVDFAAEPHNALNQPTDPTTELSYHGARWYQTTAARWLTPDPPVKTPDPRFAIESWELHPYQYVRNNPVELWDPDGREGIPNHAVKVDPLSDDFKNYYVDYNIDHIESKADPNAPYNNNRTEITIHYKDGRTLNVGLWRIPVDYPEPTPAQRKKALNDQFGHLLGPDVEIVGLVRTPEAVAPRKYEYYKIGDFVLPFDAKTGQLAFNKTTTPELVAARTYIHNYVIATGQMVFYAELVYSFVKIIKMNKAVWGTKSNLDRAEKHRP